MLFLRSSPCQWTWLNFPSGHAYSVRLNVCFLSNTSVLCVCVSRNFSGSFKGHVYKKLLKRQQHLAQNLLSRRLPFTIKFVQYSICNDFLSLEFGKHKQIALFFSLEIAKDCITMFPYSCLLGSQLLLGCCLSTEIYRFRQIPGSDTGQSLSHMWDCLVFYSVTNTVCFIVFHCPE